MPLRAAARASRDGAAIAAELLAPAIEQREDDLAGVRGGFAIVFAADVIGMGSDRFALIIFGAPPSHQRGDHGTALR